MSSSNGAVERTAGSHALAPAAQWERYAHNLLEGDSLS